MCYSVSMPNDQALLKKQLLDFLQNPHTHASLEDAADNFPTALINKEIKDIPYTAWGLLEHIRITQHDMVDFMHNPEYEEISWPAGYWPNPNQPADKKMWVASLAAYKKDFELLKKLIKNPKTDLQAKISWGSGQTMLREVLQIVDHTSYHTGELILLRRMLGAWK